MKRSGLIGLIFTLFLTSCSLLPLSAEEQSYKDDCQIVYQNYEKFMDLQNKIYDADYNDTEFDWRSWPSTYAVTNAGESTRDTAHASIKKNFPWVEALVNDYFQGIDRKEFLKQDSESWFYDDLGELGVQAFFQELVKGSSFEITMSSIKKSNSDDIYDLLNAEINDVLAKFSPSDRFKNCDDALGLDESLSFEGNWNDYNPIGMKGVYLQSVLEVSTALWGCDNFGAGYINYGAGWQKCAGSDFDYSKYATAPSNELTEEERAILAEREANAENDSGSTATSNVSPGQVCNNLGELAETESYGTLMCKLVWVNKIKALVWMRA